MLLLRNLMRLRSRKRVVFFFFSRLMNFRHCVQLAAAVYSGSERGAQLWMVAYTQQHKHTYPITTEECLYFRGCVDF